MRIKTVVKGVKVAFISALFFMAIIPAGVTEELPADSQISAVTVYPGTARVTRRADLDLSAGEHSLVFENIIPQLDENSLTVTGKGTASVKIFGAYIKKEYSKEKADQRVQELETLIQDLADQIQGENNNLGILIKEQEYLDSIKLFSGNQIPKDLVTTIATDERIVASPAGQRIIAAVACERIGQSVTRQRVT